MHIDQIGDNGPWLEPRRVPVIAEEEISALQEQASSWFGTSEISNKLDAALSGIALLSVESRSAILELLKCVQAIDQLIADHETTQRDRGMYRIMEEIILSLNPQSPALVAVRVNAKHDFEGGHREMVELVLREFLKDQLERIQEVLTKK